MQGSSAFAIMIASLRSIIYFLTVNLYVNINTTEFPKVTIGGKLIFFKTKEPSVDSYNGIYYYVSEKGDPIDFDCKNIYEEGQIRLQFYDRSGAAVIDVTTQDRRHKEINVNFRKLISDKKFNQSYVDCTYLSPINRGQQNFTYRSVFNVIPRSSDGFIVTVNDKKLTTKIHNTDGADMYTYKYSYEHLLNITCIKKKQLFPGVIYGDIVNRNKEDIVIEDFISQTSRYTASIKTRNLDGKIFQCYSEFEKYKLVADIKFLLETDRDPIVLGVIAENILYEYNSGNMDWIIHYQYTNDEVLNLTCITGDDRLLEWVYPENTTSEIHTDSVYKTNYINDIFPINTELNNNITCESKKLNLKRKVVIVLHQMPDLMPPMKFLDTGDIHQHDNEKQFTALEIIGIVAAISMAVVAGLVFVCYWQKWRKKIDNKEEGSRKSTDTVSKSLTNQEQNNEYTYIENMNNDTNNQDGATLINSILSDNSQDYGYQQVNKIYTGYTEDYFMRNGDTIDDDTMNNICNFPNRVQNMIRNEPPTNHTDNSVSGHKTNTITYNNLERISKDTNYRNLEHLHTPCYSNLCADASTIS